MSPDTVIKVLFTFIKTMISVVYQADSLFSYFHNFCVILYIISKEYSNYYTIHV